MMEKPIINMEIIPVAEVKRWNGIVKRFPHWDVYYLNEYAYSFKIHGDGEAFLIYYYYDDAQEKCELCYVVMKRDISEDVRFCGVLTQGELFDLETPYGYGGFLLQGKFSEHVRLAFENKLMIFAKKNRIVSQFVRFYPVYRNDIFYSQLVHSSVRYLKDTIYIDTINESDIMKQMDSKNRNMVRKAIKSGVSVFHDKGKYLDEFIKIYEATMNHNKASSYYYFKRSYYEYIIEHMRENIEFFYSVYENKIIGASIFFYNQEFMHYHLSGMNLEYRSMAATNLLIYEAAKWANSQGIRLLHLGGGIEAEDSLFGFKKQFNKNGRLPFYIGRTIFDEDAYKKLLAIRKRENDSFDENNGYMIQYRR